MKKMHDELNNRFDISDIVNDSQISFKNEIMIINKKIINVRITINNNDSLYNVCRINGIKMKKNYMNLKENLQQMNYYELIDYEEMLDKSKTPKLDK